MHDDDLTQRERDALAALPRERRPSDLLEERTVRGLRENGLLAAPARAGMVLRPAWAAAAAAVFAVMVAGGFLLGQWSGSRRTEEVMLAMADHDGARIAREVQRAGTAYIWALDALARGNGSDPGALAQGREAALATLQAAANEVISIAPDDPVAAAILRAIETDRGRNGAGPARPAARQVVWF